MARRWAADVVAQDVEVTIVARADVMLNIGMPVNAATKVGTDVRKDSHFPLIFSHNIQTVIDRGPLPTVDFGACEIKTGRDSNWIFFKRTQLDERLFLRPSLRRRRKQICHRRDARQRPDQSADACQCGFDEVAASDLIFVCDGHKNLLYFNSHSKTREAASTLTMVRFSFVAPSKMDLPSSAAGKINLPST